MVTVFFPPPRFLTSVFNATKLTSQTYRRYRVEMLLVAPPGPRTGRGHSGCESVLKHEDQLGLKMNTKKAEDKRREQMGLPPYRSAACYTWQEYNHLGRYMPSKILTIRDTSNVSTFSHSSRSLGKSGSIFPFNDPIYKLLVRHTMQKKPVHLNIVLICSNKIPRWRLNCWSSIPTIKTTLLTRKQLTNVLHIDSEYKFYVLRPQYRS